MNPLTMVIILQALNGLLDVVVLVLPLSAVLHLHMSKGRKFGILGVFLLGGL